MTSGLDIHFEIDEPRRAAAKTVVLAGSLGSTVAMWEPQVGSLAERFRVVRYDTRGHGRSPVPPGPYRIDDLADDLLRLLDRLEVDRAHLVGLSLGGMTAMRVAARNPDRVDRLAVLCTSALLGPAQDLAGSSLDGLERGGRAQLPTGLSAVGSPTNSPAAIR